MKAGLNYFLLTILTLTFVLGSCSSSNNVVSNRFIQKRKYNKGWHINNSKKSKDQRSSSKDDLGKMKSQKKTIDSDKGALVKEAIIATKTQTVPNQNNEPVVYPEIVKSKPSQLDFAVEDGIPIESEENSETEESEETELKESEVTKVSLLLPSFDMGPILIYLLAGFALALVIASIIVLLLSNSWLWFVALLTLVSGVILAAWAIALVLMGDGTAPYSLIVSGLAFIGGTIAALIFYFSL
jgi:VIT1/CCC1 family predicted Fe2+/Mn2+ transporter